jgi:hypothetical protein
MKKYFVATKLLTILCLPSIACDICGGGTGSYNPFLFPHLSKSYIGLNFLTRSFHKHNDDGSATRANYSGFLISGQYSVNRKLQTIFLAPYLYNKMEKGNETERQQGVGDITLLLSYKLWDRMGVNWTQALMVGGGIKLATGRYSKPKTTDVIDRNFQVGTGSMDYIINGVYRVSHRNWILNAVGSYKYNTPNKEGYRFGDLVTIGGTLAYGKNYDQFSIAPYIQITNESQLKDADNHVLQDVSGGNVLYTGLGTDVTIPKITLGANYIFAAKNISGGELNAAPRFSARVSFSL